MENFIISTEDYRHGDATIIPVTGEAYLDVWNYHGETVHLDVKSAANQPVVIHYLELLAHNELVLNFTSKSYPVTIENLILRTSGLRYLGGATVHHLHVVSDQPHVEILPNIAADIMVEYIVNEDEAFIREKLRGVTIIPGSGEYVLDPQFSHKQAALRSLDELKRTLPNIEWVAPVVSWFATSLDIKDCQIKPGVEKKSGNEWQVGHYNRATAHAIAHDGQAGLRYGGSIHDNSVTQFLDAAHARDLKIMLYPMLMVDVPKKPWRGHISGKAEHVDHFYRQHYEPFILHYANLVRGKADAFIIGSELVTLTSIHTDAQQFPFIDRLIELACKVKGILGPTVQVTYAANWHEHFQVEGGLRPLDKLWASPCIDIIGIDAYFPLTHSKSSRMTVDDIKAGWTSGEGYDYWLAGDGSKRPFDMWNAWKNLKYWWENEHWAWDPKASKSLKTEWVPGKKPIWLTEFGMPSIDKAPNRPNVFYDPQSHDGGLPDHSTGKPDFAIQRKGIRAALEFMGANPFINMGFCWTWDARGSGWHLDSHFADGYKWQRGHWIDGKLGNITVVSPSLASGETIQYALRV
jgi:hypothetical protein